MGRKPKTYRIHTLVLLEGMNSEQVQSSKPWGAVQSVWLKIVSQMPVCVRVYAFEFGHRDKLAWDTAGGGEAAASLLTCTEPGLLLTALISLWLPSSSSLLWVDKTAWLCVLQLFPNSGATCLLLSVKHRHLLVLQRLQLVPEFPCVKMALLPSPLPSCLLLHSVRCLWKGKSFSRKH